MRVVVDTNVLASGLIQRQGATGQVLRHLRDGRFTLIYSVPLLLEPVEVLSRPHIQQKYHLRSDDITVLLNLIRLRGELVSPKREINICRDPQDNFILEAAIEGNADAVVSGDKDLLDLKEFVSISILRVVEFLAKF